MTAEIKRLILSIPEYGQLIQSIVLLVGIFVVGALLTRIILGRFFRLFHKNKTIATLWENLALPTSCLGGLGLSFFALQYITTLHQALPFFYVRLSFRMALAMLCLLFVMGAIESILVIVQQRMQAAGKMIPVSVPFFGRVLKIILSILFFFIVVPTFLVRYNVRFFNALAQYVGISTLSASAIAGFSLQPILKDILGGLGVISQKLFNEGDWVQVNEGRISFVGRVQEVGLRYTKLKHWKGSITTLPNKMFLTSVIENYGRAHYTEYAISLLPSSKGELPIERFIEGYEKLISDAEHIDEKLCHVTVRKLEVGKMNIHFHVFFNKSDDKTKVVHIHEFWQKILQLARTQKLSFSS